MVTKNKKFLWGKCAIALINSKLSVRVPKNIKVMVYFNPISFLFKIECSEF